jgi:hypothetical protein
MKFESEHIFNLSSFSKYEIFEYEYFLFHQIFKKLKKCNKRKRNKIRPYWAGPPGSACRHQREIHHHMRRLGITSTAWVATP